MSSIKLPQYIWHNQKDVEFPLPDDWKVKIHNIAGHARPALKPEQIKKAISSPIGTQPLRELAKGKKQVVIIFDDMTRGTRTYEILPCVLEELAAAGIKDNQIRFIAAVANHQALQRSDTAKKLGDAIIERFPVFNHTSFIHCSYIGTTSYGTKVSINDEVMRCDLKIAIGSVVPHPQYGFGGGAKVILPGVAAYETVKQHHQVTHAAWSAEQRKKGTQLRGTIKDNPSNADAREAARMVGLDMLIDCLLNGKGETTDIFAGALEPAYQTAVKEAEHQYLAENTRDNDIVIANAFIKASEYTMASAAMPAVNPNGGSIVFIANSPTGEVVHYLFDAFGKQIDEGGYTGAGVPNHIKNYIIYTEFPEARLMERFVGQERALMTRDWAKVIERLKKTHGDGAKVAVYPNADTMYLK